MTLRTLTITTILLLGLTALTGCVSRYDLDLFLVRGETSKEVKIDRTEFIKDGVLNVPTAREKIVPGSGNCLVIHTGTRGETVAADAEDLLQWDKYLQFDIFIQLASRVEPTSINLVNNSYVLLVGEYDRPLAERVFSAEDGTVVIDSIPNDFLYASINSVFVNPIDDTVRFAGDFRVRIEN
ncbi:hypothetical protein GF377_07330 [candidate division GN15 bacterium]|nr:hypothetical protein [candidate division GN15 bacterium]